jgi:DNA polymerase
MRLVRLGSEIDFEAWRAAARSLIAEGIAPHAVEWRVGEAASLLAGDENRGQTPISLAALSFTVPRAFVNLAQSAVLHSDPGRFALVYRLLWGLREEPRLMSVASDADVARARTMSQAVRREIHKIHAFVRFREAQSDAGPAYVAWFEPAHHTLEAAAPFFMRRFATMRWAILSPRVCAHWDGAALRFGPGADRADAPDGDALEALWRTYYASIFNPARLKTDTMRAHMPRKYWSNLPEAELIGALVAGAPRAMQKMIDEPATSARLRLRESARPLRPAEVLEENEPVRDSVEATREAALRCRACPLYASATQTVFGEGDARAQVMFVGEQPGDQEDLVGRPFVGPAGRLFDRALNEAGIERAATYVTNAVKHFKFEPRGTRRIHKTPAQREVEACRPWLEHEIRLVQPRLIVALGATAAHSVLGRPTPVQRNRGRLIPVSDDTKVLVTVHPSYLLRLPEDQQAGEYQRFVDDLRLARRALTSGP